MPHKTHFGSLENFEKGGIEVINDDPRNYVFSNIYEVASKAEPYEKIAVGKNLKYVLEAVRAEGTSPWYTASHDESAIIMDGEVEIRLVKLNSNSLPRTTRAPPCSKEIPTEKDGLHRRAPWPHGAAAQKRGIPVSRAASRG